MAAVASLPTLSQVQTLDTAYLREAAQYWTRTANLWEQVFTEIHDRMSKTAGAGVLAGIAILGGRIAGGVASGGQIAR
ncbi:hypothetical protein F0Q45_11260 [Mycobacterium simiae]|uniref:Uncharacterized protein n=1 Tax=Mycobacterium simiae TaxID=1784 RepID=A0A5B1BN51_MYCSI|nr:hypothetical protein [Mycobacterium simiae]KAA1250138.1 hypothetical protein F0Q45_11260 [Mycobacterium simiae]